MKNRMFHFAAALRSSPCFALCSLLGALALFPPQTADGQTPRACVRLSPATLTVSETNAIGEYEALLLLSTLASGEIVYVVPTISAPNPNVALSVLPKQMRFESTDIPQGGGVVLKKFRVAVRPDADAVGGVVKIDHAVLGPNCQQEGGAVTVTVTDTGPPVLGVRASKERVILAETNANAANSRLDGEYTLRLASYPTGNVSIETESSDSLAARAAPKKLTFTQDNWFEPQTVTVTPQDDDDGDDENLTISHKVSGGGYGNVTAPDVAVLVVDPDPVLPTPGVTVSESSISLHEGQTQTYTIKLDTDPTATVFILPTSSDVTAVTATPNVLEFTAGALTTANATTHWSAPHLVTVTAVQDNADSDNETVTIRHTAAGGDYANIDIGTVSVSVWDDEARAVTISESALIIDEGQTAMYTVKLGGRPLGTVTLATESSEPDKVSVSPASLEFTVLQWNTPQTVTLRALRDSDTDGESARITHTPSGGGYAAVKAPDVVVVVNDTGTATSAEDSDATTPTEFALEGNYPNPFNPSTEIAWSLPQQAHVTLTVYDAAGREVRRLVDASQPAGRHSVNWDGTDAQGSPLRSGVYFYRLSTEDWRETKSMVLLK